MRHTFTYNASRLPPEFYGLERDSVRLLAIDRDKGIISASPFLDINDYLETGDLLVFNDSLVVPSSLSAAFVNSRISGKINFGTSSERGMILCEPRPRGIGKVLERGEDILLLPAMSRLRLEGRHRLFPRYWWASADDYTEFQHSILEYAEYVRYDHVPFSLPPSIYKTFFSTVPGSVEFPSACRPFTARVIHQLQRKGIRFATVTLHCNLGSMEDTEFETSDRLLDEEYCVTDRALKEIYDARDAGRRVIAVGTTVLRALESCALAGGESIHSRTDIFIRPGFKFRIVDGLITGLHEPDGSHADLVSSFVEESTLLSAYSTAEELGFTWHEFGDVSLIV